MDTNNLSSSANNSSSQTGVAHLTSNPIYVLTDLPSPTGSPVYVLLSDLLIAATELGKQMFIEQMRKEGIAL